MTPVGTSAWEAGSIILISVCGAARPRVVARSPRCTGSGPDRPAEPLAGVRLLSRRRKILASLRTERPRVSPGAAAGLYPEIRPESYLGTRAPGPARRLATGGAHSPILRYGRPGLRSPG